MPSSSTGEYPAFTPIRKSTTQNTSHPTRNNATPRSFPCQKYWTCTQTEQKAPIQLKPSVEFSYLRDSKPGDIQPIDFVIRRQMEFEVDASGSMQPCH
jgi:hypothetical protein